MRLRILFACFLVLVLIACQPAPTEINSTATLPPGETPPLATTTPAPTASQVADPTPTIAPEFLQEQASPLCEKSFSALVETGPLTAPFAVLKYVTYANAPAWELAHQLPHRGSLSADQVRTVFCISETRVQTGTYTDGSPAYQFFWDMRAVSFPDGKVVGRNSFTGSTPPKTNVLDSGSPQGLFPYAAFAAWVFDRVEHPDFLHVTDAITPVAISPDGRITAFSTSPADQIVDQEYQAKITLFNTSNLQRSSILDVLDGHQGMVTSLAFSPDGKTLASSGFDRFVKFWDVSTGRLLGQVSVADTPNALAFSPDGSKLAVASNLEIFLIDPASRQVSQSIQETGGNAAAFSPDGNQIYVHSSGSIKIVDPDASRVILTFPDPFALVPTTIVSEDGSISVNYESPETVAGFALAPDGSQIVTYTMDRPVEGEAGTESIRLAIWNAETGKFVKEVEFPGGLIRAIEFSPDGKQLAVGNGDELWLWDTTDWQVKQKLAGHTGEITDLAFTPDSTKIFSASSDGTLRVWALKE